jgi:NAD(P)-dependent dehydrogenase (short-subunit alcohol dehydrogenase family)
MNGQQVILITGCSSGFGRLSAQTLARQGHIVFASMRDIGRRNATVRSELDDLAKSENLNLQVIELDITNDFSVKDAVTEVIDRAGRIDVLVNNAGVLYVGVTEAFTIEQVQRQIDVNFFGVIRMNRAVLPHMRRQGNGLLIHISSIAGRAVIPFFGIFNASKFALEALAESYRYELSGLGIDSVIVEPGPYGSNLIASNSEAEDRTRLAEYGNFAELPMKILAAYNEYGRDPQEVADVIAQLIDTPAGQRPLRTICGLDFQVKDINKATEPIQRSIIEAAGLQSLLQLTHN